MSYWLLIFEVCLGFGFRDLEIQGGIAILPAFDYIPATKQKDGIFSLMPTVPEI